ncbi:GDSL-type esterase/lipase family protein [Aquirufa sp. ROCK2-A2]
MKNVLLIALLFLGQIALAQNKFEAEIKAYEKQDSVAMPKTKQILFLGSSSFRLWKTFDQDLKGLPVFNRGFGGSTLEDALYYFDRMVVKYQPSWIFLYEGDNDLAKGQSPEFIEKEFVEFSERLSKKLPKTKLVFVAARPSLARVGMVDNQKDLNKRIEQLVSGKKNLYYLDMHSPFYLADGTLMQDIFVADKLHLNEKGYQIFASKIRTFIETIIIK